ncbi:hypothetical protein PXH81_03335 [Xylella fastidiosa]|jgi:hypothetical protein|uniref:Uncharacterized protein n=1 Tax=Xylella fastidiosa subsp. multiplex TaxID=644357 RepID=A0AAW6HVG1_XYLFS|nr:hypothetical protein [Xylella fastidiosa]MDC6408591.1 hypothetical protein [Xylella fastidiosa subsp. multiplex]MDD0936813.1 hypothetical protein [Xylella fastidiosa subsp. multiplex]MSS67804.1 hypothetical protein [Xylella fastidiosa subsp. multiplex]QIS25926.1 hypothetical protein F7G16_06875 [Xylella fastidiosa]RWA34396.1 hypothetical protein XfCFBP7970_11275 [Xylella fastidiosa subsp. fastidiosa]
MKPNTTSVLVLVVKTLISLSLVCQMTSCQEHDTSSIEQDTSLTLAERIIKINKGVVSAREHMEDGKPLLIVDIGPSSTFSNSALLFDASTKMVDILAKSQKIIPKDGNVEFRIITELEDRYGNTKEDAIMTIGFTGSDIEKINFGNKAGFTGWSLLNLAQPPKHITFAGREAISEYCSDDSNRNYADLFCLPWPKVSR